MEKDLSLLCKGGWYPYITVGLDITNSRAQFISFLGASTPRLIWNGLQLAVINVMQQRSEDLPSSLRTNGYGVRVTGIRRALEEKYSP